MSFHDILPAVNFLYAQCWSAWYCIDIVKRSFVLIAFEIVRFNWFMNILPVLLENSWSLTQKDKDRPRRLQQSWTAIRRSLGKLISRNCLFLEAFGAKAENPKCQTRGDPGWQYSVPGNKGKSFSNAFSLDWPRKDCNICSSFSGTPESWKKQTGRQILWLIMSAFHDSYKEMLK